MTKSLRILFVIETGGGGSGRHVIDIARAFADQGHAVSIAYSPEQAEDWFQAAVSALEGVRSYCQQMRHAPHISDIAAIRGVRKIIQRDGPFDIVHGHSSKGGAIARIAALRTRTKVLYTPHAFVTLNALLPRSKRIMYGLIEKLLVNLADALICVSSAEYEHAVSMGIETSRLRLIPNGLDPLPNFDRSAVRKELGLNPEHIAIGFVGRLVPQKAVDHLIAAFAIVGAAIPQARLIIVGDGGQEAQLRKQAADLGLSESIVWAGSQNGARLMTAFDIYALSSIYEAFPYVLIEAALHGLPIVATRVGGTAELVHEGRNGALAPIGDVPAFAGALMKLVEDQATRERLGTESAILGKSFTADAMASRTLELYRDLLAQPD